MKVMKYTARYLEVIAVGAALTTTVPLATAIAVEPFHYSAENVDVAAHWAARSTLGNALMFSGLGQPLNVPMSMMDEILGHAGYTARPPMPDMAMVGAVYAAGSPTFAQAPDFGKPRTLRWDPDTFERTVGPAAQAWALIKITSPEFHLNFHDGKADRRIALMMAPQAQAQARILGKELLTEQGLFAARRPDGTSAEPLPRDQAVVLWGISNLILAATSPRVDYWHKAYRDLIDPDNYLDLADRAFAAVENLPSESPADRAVAIEGLGRYALATKDGRRRGLALQLARTHADVLRQVSGGTLSDLALAVYGLTEAGRLLRDERYATAAARLFRSALLPRWDNQPGVFKTDGSDALIVYTAATTAAVVAALNAMRWHGPATAAKEADRIYPKFLEAVLIHAGLQRSSPLVLVSAGDREKRPSADFAHPALPSPGEARVAPVFAGEVRYEKGAWRVSDPMFQTADALFLANMLVMRREGRADAFLPADRLATITQ